jgi:hypothetical protein
MNESEIHSVNRKTCREFLGEMLRYIDMPITLIEVNMRRQNPDFKMDMVPNQKKIHARLKKMEKELKELGEAFRC